MTLPVSLTSLTRQVQRIPLDSIKESIVTLRTQYNERRLDELGDSLLERGQLQTIVVQPSDGGSYELVIGSRRLRAARRKGMQDIAAYVIEQRSPVELLLIALAENLHRTDLNPFEEAQAFLKLMKEHGFGVKEIAKGVNKPTAYVRRRLQLLSMPDEVALLVSDKKIGLHHVPTLAKVSSGEKQVQLAQRAATHGLTEKELRVVVARELHEPSPIPRATPHALTAIKLQAKLGEFADFLQKVPDRMNVLRMNADEKEMVQRCLRDLENQARSLSERVGNKKTAANTSASTRVPRDLALRQNKEAAARATSSRNSRWVSMIRSKGKSVDTKGKDMAQATLVKIVQVLQGNRTSSPALVLITKNGLRTAAGTGTVGSSQMLNTAVIRIQVPGPSGSVSIDDPTLRLKQIALSQAIEREMKALENNEPSLFDSVFRETTIQRIRVEVSGKEKIGTGKAARLSQFALEYPSRVVS